MRRCHFAEAASLFSNQAIGSVREEAVREDKGNDGKNDVKKLHPGEVPVKHPTFKQ